jgi:O-Antigen ligase
MGQYLIIFIPGIICMAAILRAGTRHAFLSVYLPVSLFLPCMFGVRLPHLPPMSFEDTTLLSLGIGMILMDLSRWRFSRMDCWVALFIFTTAYAERIPWGVNGAFLVLFGTVLVCWVPYMAGKLLVERPGMRAETVRRIVVLMAVVSVFAIPQFFLKSNLYIYFWSHFFPGQWVNPGTREGFGRVDGPYGGGETAGMVFLIGLLLALWLQHYKTKNLGAIGYLGRPFKHGRVIILILATTLCMTQSRGPWLGAVIAVLIASIGRAKNTLRQAVLVFGLGLVVGIPLYSMAKDYASGPPAQIGSEQQTAQYRQALIDNFVPIAKMGGAWGWGNSFPHPGGQDSIDNEYLLVWLLQGYVGLTALILIVVEGIASFVRAGIKARSFQERYFVLTLLGILLGLAVCVFTVWLAGEPYEMFFLIMGWSQALHSVDAGNQRQQDDRVIHELPRPDSMLVLT